MIRLFLDNLRQSSAKKNKKFQIDLKQMFWIFKTLLKQHHLTLFCSVYSLGQKKRKILFFPTLFNLLLIYLEKFSNGIFFIGSFAANKCSRSSTLIFPVQKIPKIYPKCINFFHRRFKFEVKYFDKIQNHLIDIDSLSTTRRFFYPLLFSPQKRKLLNLQIFVICNIQRAIYFELLARYRRLNPARKFSIIAEYFINIVLEIAWGS